MTKNIKINYVVMTLLFLIFFSITELHACTKTIYTGEDGLVITGRTTDWAGRVDTNLWIFPRGIRREGLAGPKSVKWTSKYGSVAASVHDIMTIDGMNEKGLTASILRLKESEFIPQKEAGKRKPLGISLWGQYFLDNFATVDEAVKAMKKDNIYVVPLQVENGESSGMHLVVSDASGDFAIFEYMDNQLKIYHNKKFKAATNSPQYSSQLAIRNYWNNVDGKNFLPGSANSSDRLVRAFYYANKLPKTSDRELAESYMLSLMRNVSSPLGIINHGNQEESATLWRTISNQKDMTYYYESVYKTYGFTIDLKKINFDADQRVKEINLMEGDYYFGDATDKFVDAVPFDFASSFGQIIRVKQ